MIKTFLIFLLVPFLSACLYGQSVIPLDNGKYLVQVYGELSTFDQARKSLEKQARSKCPDFSVEHESLRVVDPWNGINEYQWIIQCPK